MCVCVACFLKTYKLVEEYKWDNDSADVKVLLISPKGCACTAFLFTGNSGQQSWRYQVRQEPSIDPDLLMRTLGLRVGRIQG